MTAEADESRRPIHLLVPDSASSRILVRRDPGTAIQLPVLDILGDPEVPELVAAIGRLLGPAAPTILRVIRVGADKRDVLVELEPWNVRRAPPGLAWRPFRSGDVAAVTPAELVPALDRWVEDRGRGRGSSPRRQSWSEPGWLARATGWMTERLAEAGTPITAPPSLHSMWGLSAVIRAETTSSAAFLKSCARVFGSEPAMTRALAAASPEITPAVVAIDVPERWLLMRDLGSRFVGDQPVTRWASALGTLAQVQRSWLDRGGELAIAGFEDRGLAVLAASLPTMIGDPILGGLDDEARVRLERALPALLEACDRLGRIAPFSTVVHGDFHPWNVADHGERDVIFDWSDACIGHPFIDLVTYGGRTPKLSERREMIRHYLAQWSDLASPESLEVAVDAALPLGAMHQVESYRRIVGSLEPDDAWDLDQAPLAFAQSVPDLLDHGLADASQGWGHGPEDD